MTNETTQVAIIMGSDSDLPVVEAIFPILESFGVKFTKNVMSAHRTPHDVMKLISDFTENGKCTTFIYSVLAQLATYSMRCVIYAIMATMKSD